MDDDVVPQGQIGQHGQHGPHLRPSATRRGLGRGLGAILPARGMSGVTHTSERAASPARDPLTGLAGRTELLEELDAALATARHDDSAVALVVLGLDGFRHVNAQFGHEVGDALLADLARRLAGSARASDAVSRVSGDEFALVCPRFDPSGAPARIVDRLRAEVERPVAMAGTTHRLRATMGVAATERGVGQANGRSLLRSADLAMHRAKDEGRPWAAFLPTETTSAPAGRFPPRSNEPSAERSSWLHYRALVDLHERRLVGARVEASTRLASTPTQHGEALVGLLADVSSWAGVGLPAAFRVWLGVPAAWLADPEALPFVERAVAAAGVHPRSLGFAVRAFGHVLGGSDAAEPAPAPALPAALARLRDAEVGLSLDASEVATAAHLGLLDLVTALDLPNHLVAAFAPADPRPTARPPSANRGSPPVMATCRALAGLGRELGLAVVAHGVDTDALESAAAAAGCTHAVGNRYGAPSPPERFAAVVKSATSA